MTFMVNFVVDGVPVGKGRPRFTSRGPFVRTYTPKKTMDYEDVVRETARLAMGETKPLETAVTIYLYIRMPIPASYSKARTKDCLMGVEKHTKKPDWDNVAKAITDALNGIVYVDDCQIVSAHIKKLYGADPCVDVLVKEELE